jgi:hypothetical protein
MGLRLEPDVVEMGTSMVVETPIASHEPQSDVFIADRLIQLQGSWEHFTLIQQGCEQTPAAHLFYLDGTIEILMPGRPHEVFWFWEDGTLALYHLRETGYTAIAQSELEGLKHLDIDILKHHILIAETDLGAAVRSFSAYIQQLP